MNTQAHRSILRGAALTLALAALAVSPRDAAADAPDRTQVRTQARTESEGATTHATTAPSTDEARPVRVYFGWGVLYVPPWFHAENGKYDLVLHFHGGAFLQEETMEQTRLNAVVVSVNLGINTGPYSDVYAAPGALDRLLARTDAEMQKTHRAPGARVGRIALAAWSAGFAAVGGILSQPGAAQRIDAVLLADGFHAAYLGYPGSYRIYGESLEKWKTFADLAVRGEKLFAMTHSSVPTSGYASTTETTGELLRMLNLPKSPHPSVGPRSMQEIYEVDRGNLHVKGFEGIHEKDHIDHIKGMAKLVYPYLKERWSRGS